MLTKKNSRSFEILPFSYLKSASWRILDNYSLFANHYWLLSNCLVSSIRHQGHEAGEFDGVGNHPLMFGTKGVAFGGADLELSCYKRTQEFGVLVVNITDIVFTKFTMHMMFVGEELRDCEQTSRLQTSYPALSGIIIFIF